MCLLLFFFFTIIMRQIYIIQSVVLKPPVIKIYQLCAYIFRGSAARGPGSYKGSREQESRDLVNLLELFPSFGDECLVNNRKEKKNKKKIQVSFFSLFFRLDVSSFVQFEKKNKKNLEVRAEHTGVIQRGSVGPGSRGSSGRGVGVVGGPPSFTHWCCCSPGLYTECLLRCSPSRGAGRRTCPRTSRCLACGHEMACTVGQ